MADLFAWAAAPPAPPPAPLSQPAPAPDHEDAQAFATALLRDLPQLTPAARLAGLARGFRIEAETLGALRTLTLSREALRSMAGDLETAAAIAAQPHAAEAKAEEAPWAPHGAIAWPRRDPSPEELADPAFRAVFDAIRGWTIYEPADRGYGFASAQHAALILAALRRAGALPGAMPQ